MPDLPTLIFVPGSWHKPTCYSKTTQILIGRYGFKCCLVTLPSTTGDPNATFEHDINAARKVIVDEITAGRDVVVLAHSYGGMVGNSAIKGFTRPKHGVLLGPERSIPGYASGHAEVERQSHVAANVIGLILIASGYTLTGLAFMDPFFGIPPPSWRVNKETGFAELVAPPKKFFYHDLPADEAAYWASQLTPQSLKSLFEGGEHAYAGWQDVPTWYIGTVEDQGLPVVAQRMQIGMAREMGGSVQHRELQTSHSPFLSQPEEVVAITLDAVEAFTGKVFERKNVAKDEVKKILLPRPRLLSPSTWFKFGLPLMFGHIIGRGIVFFGWGRGLWRSVFT